MHSKNSSIIQFNRSMIEGSVNARFQTIVNKVPDQVAVDTLTDRFTYSQLDVFSNNIAQAILSHSNLKEGLPIALIIDQGHLAVVSLLGVLKAGHSFIIYPANSPVEQLKILWEDSLEPLILTSRKNLGLTRDVVKSEENRLIVEDCFERIGIVSYTIIQPGPEDLAVVSYTSGSTGKPKGVMWSHRLVLHTAYQNQASYAINSDDRYAVLASFGFGAATTQCLAALLNGATLFLPDLKQLNISLLYDWLYREDISILAMPPIPLLRQIMNVLDGKKRLPKLRLVILGGDDLFKQDVERFWACFGFNTELVYRLAGSESMLIRELKILPDMEFAEGKIPVGYPVPDKEVLLLDENGNEVSDGEIGEIVVRSNYISNGYWGQPEETINKFKVDGNGSGKRIYKSGDLARVNSLGQLELVGRKDNAVKIRGFSVNLEVVDMALQKLSFVQDAVTIVDPIQGGDKRLISYLVPRTIHKPTISEIRKELAVHLQDHMIPSLFVWLESLPRTSTGKPDRKLLPKFEHSRPSIKTALVPPRNDREKTLSDLWQNLLQLDQVGVNDNFFELGGDSLLFVRMVLEVEKTFKIKIPTKIILDVTIARLSELIHEYSTSTKVVDSTHQYQENPNLSHKKKRNSKFRSAIEKLIINRISLSDVWNKVGRLFSNVSFTLFLNVISLLILRKPYNKGLNLITWIASMPVISHGLFRSQYNLFHRMILELKDCKVDPEEAYKSYMVGNLIEWLRMDSVSEDETIKLIDRFRTSGNNFWSSLAHLIDEAPINELDKYFSVSGLEILENAYKKGLGVILLTYHSTPNRLAIAALPRRLDGEHIPTVSKKIAKQNGVFRVKRNLGLSNVDRSMMFAEIALNGQRSLEQGKIIQFVSDNSYQQNGQFVVLAGRKYKLQLGFAELALNSGTPIVPQYSTIYADGHIHTTILPEFVFGTGDRNSRIVSLMDQYADFINSSWKNAPESIRWSRLKSHFRLAPNI